MINLDHLYNKDAAADFFGKNHFVDKKLHFQIIERGTLLPHKEVFVNGRWTWGFGGIVDRKGEFIKNSFVHYGVGGAYTPTEEIQRSPQTVVYLGMFFDVWGHVLTDNLRRLWFLKSEIFNRYFKNCMLVYLPWGGVLSLDHPQQRDFRRLLEILEVDVNRLVPIYHPVQFANIIMPDESFFTKGDTMFFTNEYRETIDQIRHFALKNQTPTSSKKIYFFYGAKQIGEERMAEYFKSKGYEIITHAQRSDVDEELNILINAENFASPEGSCAHNSVFLRDGTETILIPRSANAFTGYQQAIDQVHPSNANYVDSSLSVFNEGHDLFCFIISKQLKEFFGEEFTGYTDDDFKIFLTYIRYAMSIGRKINNKEATGYGATFADFMTQLSQRKDLLQAYGVNLT